jgi:hypothetical protein
MIKMKYYYESPIKNPVFVTRIKVIAILVPQTGTYSLVLSILILCNNKYLESSY